MESKSRKRLKPLPNEIRSIVRSGITINTVAQCVEELVCNSIDAKGKSIHIGVNLDQFNVRVEDDGVGIIEADLEEVGVRYNTSKCNSLVDLSKLAYYGFRGEALASIVDISKSVDIITRPKENKGVELKKRFENGTAKKYVEKYNTSIKTSGTTVIVEKLLSRLPVRQHRIDRSIQLEEIKSALERIALINPSLSIELRNEKNGTQLFIFQPSTSYADAFNQIFQSRIGFEVKFMDEHFLHKNLFFNLSVSGDFVKKKHYQFVFVNNRCIHRCKLHKWVGNFILDRRKDSESHKSDKYPVFILNITCPFNEYDVTLEPKKQIIEFKDWDAVYDGLDGLVTKLKHKNSFVAAGDRNKPVDKNVSRISSYNVKGATHSRFAAREAEAPSSLTDSDRGSVGKVIVSKPATKAVNDRNLTRTGHSSHVVDVREIRRKRKMEATTVSKPAPIPTKPNVAANNAKRPSLTLKTFKQFPAWKSEFDKAPPPKRCRDSYMQEQDMHTNNVPVVQPEANKEIPTTVQNPPEIVNFNWKINRFMTNLQAGATKSMIVESKMCDSPSSQSSIEVYESNPHDINKTKIKLLCKTPRSNGEDASGIIFNWTARLLTDHFKGKCSLRVGKEDIIKRLFKYYRATNKEPNKITKHQVSETKSCGSIERTEVSHVNSFKTPMNSTTNPKLSFGNTQPFSISEVCPLNYPAHVSTEETDNIFCRQILDSYQPVQDSFASNSSRIPPLLNLFPIQNPFTTDMSDKMNVNNQAAPDDNYRATNKEPNKISKHQVSETKSCGSIERTEVSHVNSFKTPMNSTTNPKLSFGNTQPFSISEVCPLNYPANVSTEETDNIFCRQILDSYQPVQDSFASNSSRIPPLQMNSTTNPKLSFGNTQPFSISEVCPLNYPAHVSTEETDNIFCRQILDSYQPVQDSFASNSSRIPPLLNLFPIQKPFTTDWNDKMIANDYAAPDDNAYPEDSSVEVVVDEEGKEWLQTFDKDGRDLYINLTSGESTYDMTHRLGSMRTRRLTVREMKTKNPARFNWLRKHFPKGFKQFLNGQGREILKYGDLTKLNNSTISDSVLKCIGQQNQNHQWSKWKDSELMEVSKYFSIDKESNLKTVNNITTAAAGIQSWKNLVGTISAFKFNREDFELVDVIGQYDKKFILARIRKSSADNPTLVVFDQHAVHERVRLEELINETYTSKGLTKYIVGVEAKPPYILFLSETEVRVMQNSWELFRQAAIKFEVVSSTSVKIKMVPKCFMNKCMNEPKTSRPEVFRNLIYNLVQELIHKKIDTKTANLTALPKVVHDVLCSQACHGAIKFGDDLDAKACKELILQLRNCKNLFQCAHGRPSVVPLIMAKDLLKVSTVANVCFQERPICPVDESDIQEESSEYFCPPPETRETSSYFSRINEPPVNESLENIRLPIFTGTQEETSLPISTHFFPFFTEDKKTDQDNERSPYFLFS